jgi:hypothetical protein
VWGTDRLRGLRASHWIGLSAAIMGLEYYTGPFVQFAILLIFPVTLATLTHGLRVGIALAFSLPLLRLSFFVRWPMLSSWTLAVADAVIDVLILAGTALLIERMARQERELRVLQGLLPICSFCKRIRDGGGQWRQLETYITERSAAQFSHTFCPECGRRHYPGLAD